jgi:hypothetical protein
MSIINQTNNFQNSKNETSQDFKGANIENQKNYFLVFQFDWIFKSFKNKDLSTKQFLFLLFVKPILLILIIGLILLPFFSVNKNNISTLEFAIVIIAIIFLCSWIWNNKIKTQEE